MRRIALIVLFLVVCLCINAPGQRSRYGSKEKDGMQLLSSTFLIIGDNSNGSKIDLYTVPPGKNGIIEYVILREPSHTLAACNDVNFGIGAATTGTWLDNETGLVDITATNDYMVLERTNHISNDFSVIDGDDGTASNRVFGIYVVTGATENTGTITIDVFGYIW